MPYTQVLVKITQSIECLAHNLNTQFRSYRDVEEKTKYVQFVIPVSYTQVLIKITQSIECLAHNSIQHFVHIEMLSRNKVQFVIPVPYTQY